MSQDLVSLWDWRRRIADVYAAVRAEPDQERAWLHWRETRDGMFRGHPQTPLEPAAEFRSLEFFPYDPTLVFHVKLSPIHDAAMEAFPAGHDGELLMRPFACTHGLENRLGGEATLYWLSGYGGGTFLPFADLTNGRETYGAGRYLLDTVKGADLGTTPDGRTVLDFNFAYNPSCAYSPRYVCPLTPAANRLPGTIRAGERAPA